MFKYQLPIIQDIRAVKSAREIKHITRAQKISELVLIKVVSRLKVGITEVALARFIVHNFKQRGITALAFEPIVAFGKNTADIHHWATATKLKVGDTVMFDFGCTVQGYCSDMTRTYFFGTPLVRQKRVYAAVLEAQNRALKLLIGGERRAGKVDSSARTFLFKKFGRRAFPHGLGHGVGMAIHEWPNFKPGSTDVLKPGMIMTVEPGLYFKGWGGVRIDDMVVITKTGCDIITTVSKKLNDVVVHE